MTQLDRFIKQIIFQAGKSVRKNYGVITTGTAKTSQHDIVTEADYASERILISAIRKKFPYHNILSEESGELRGKSQYTWIIDPIDGTSNFARQIPLFGIIVALVKNNTVTHGAIYDPIHDEYYYAKRKHGSYCNGRKIHVSQVTRLEDMVVTISNVRLRSSLEQFAHWRSLLALHTTYYKSFGSAAQTFMALASGKIDAYMIGGAYPWDIAAGGLLVQEAGGIITQLDGRTWDWRDNNQHILATNKSLHKQLVNIL
ncbi:MAG: inositol monophosphatase family protein [Patescibacteria group bacterium]